MGEVSLGRRVGGWLAWPFRESVAVLKLLGVIKVKTFRWEAFPGDRDVPLRRWARCAQSVVASGIEDDTGELELAKKALNEGWNVHDAERYRALLEVVHGKPEQDLAWNLARLIAVSRMAITAGYIDEDEGWRDIRNAAEKLRGKYASWEELAEGMREGLDRQAEANPQPWNKPARKLMQSNVEKLSETLWADTPWDVEF